MPKLGLTNPRRRLPQQLRIGADIPLCYNPAMNVGKTMEFILAQQAQFTVDLNAQREEFSAEIGVLRSHLGQFQEIMMTWVNRSEARTQQRDEKLSELTEDVHALVQVVDGLVRRGNGSDRS
jgi:hypothetical protein